MKILVTGGAGFIGSHLCKYLLDQGHKVICLDNFFTSSKENIKHLLKNKPCTFFKRDTGQVVESSKKVQGKNFKLIEHNINHPLPLGKIGKIDQIYNLACPASPPHYQFDPVETVKTNVLGVINVLELARQSGARILQASTSEVYGDPKEHPQKESYVGSVNPLSPRACYDEGKRCAETLFMDYHRQYGLEIKIVRIFNTYGPRMDIADGRVVSNFIIQALTGEDITIYGDGSQTRSFQYISDLIEGMVKMMESPKDIIGPINLGNPQEISVKEFAEKIIELTGSNSKFIFYSLPEYDPVQRRPDIALAKEFLSWQPEVSLKEGLKKTVEYFKERTAYINKKALVFISGYLPLTGGAELTLKELTKRLKNIEFDIITTRLRKDLAKFEKDENVNIHRLGRGSLFDKYLFPFAGFLRAAKIYKKQKYSLVWAIAATYAGLAAFLFKLTHPRVNYLLTLRESTSETKIKKLIHFFPLYKLVYKKANFIQAMSSGLEKRAREYGYSGRIAIIPGAVDLDQFNPKFSESKFKESLGIKSSDKVIITVSHLIPEAGIDDLIKSLIYIDIPNLKLLIIGEGEEKNKLERMAENLNLKDNVLFLGYIDHQEIAKYLKIANLFVRPATSSGSGITILEAIASGLPIISTLSGGAGDFLIDRKTGLVIESRNPKDIANKIQELFFNQQLKEDLIRNGQKFVLEKYCWDKIAIKMRDVFNRLLNYSS